MSFLKKNFANPTPPNIKKLKLKQDVLGLIEALDYQEDMLVRMDAAMELGEIGDLRAVEPLISLLKDEKWQVKEEATKALRKIGIPAVQSLITALADNNREVAWRVARLLGEIGDARAVAPLVAILDYSDNRTRLNAIGALGHIKDKRAVKPLLTALKSEDNDVREEAARALSWIGWEPTDDIERAEYAVNLKKWDQAASLGEKAIAPLVAAWLSSTQGNLKTSRPHDQIGIVEALGKIGNERAVLPLIKFLQDRPNPIEIEYDPDSILEELTANSLEKMLMRCATDVAKQDLITAASLVDKVAKVWPTKDGELFYGVGKLEHQIDLSRIRQLAQEELHRRSTKIGE